MGDPLLVTGLAFRLECQFQLQAKSELEWSVLRSGLVFDPAVNISLVDVLQVVVTRAP
jgi:hypothetical protein